jgi:hypothetical protein
MSLWTGQEQPCKGSLFLHVQMFLYELNGIWLFKNLYRRNMVQKTSRSSLMCIPPHKDSKKIYVNFSEVSTICYEFLKFVWFL